jgi:hypothetical protein
LCPVIHLTSETVGVQQHAHALGQQFPARFADGHDDDQRRDAVQRQIEPLRDKRAQDHAGGEDVGTILSSIGDQSRRVGRPPGAQLKVAESEGDRRGQDDTG